MNWYPKTRMERRKRIFQAIAVDSSKPTHDVILLEMNAVRDPVTAKVHRIRINWGPVTFHFCCSLFNMMQREEKNECVVNFLYPFILNGDCLTFS